MSGEAMIQRWAKVLVSRAKFVVLFGVLAVVGAGVYGSGVFASLSDGGFEDPDSESAQELALERETFGNRSVDVIAIYSSDDLRATDPAFRAEVRETITGLSDDAVASVSTYYDARSPDLLSEDGRSTQVLISLAGVSQDEMSDNYDVVKDELRSDRLDTDLAGAWAVYGDVNEIAAEDLERAELFS
ncbi:MAG: MMPL family transporter, partial [Nocardioidaceae bacterium]